MNTHDMVELPPLPKRPEFVGPYTAKDMQAYALAAIEADRQARGEPVAYRLLRKNADGDWVTDGRLWCDGIPDGDLVRNVAKSRQYRIEYAYAAPQPAEPVKVPSDDLAHEIWAAAQTAPGEGIEDAVERIAALLARYSQSTEPVKVPEGYVLIAEDYLEVMIGSEHMDHLRRSCRFPVTKRKPDTQPAEIDEAVDHARRAEGDR